MQMKFKVWGLCGSLFMGMGGEVEATEYHLYPAEMGRAGETTGDFPSIQAALDGASPGDVITLYPGVYPASLHFPRVDIKLRGHPDFEASQIVLQGIECAGATEASWCSILHFDWQGEGPLADEGQARVENLTLLGGEGALFDGEGPQQRRFGGALWMHSADPHLTDLVIKGNRVSGMGGGLYAWASNPHLKRVEVRENHAAHGGGLALIASEGTILQSTLIANRAGEQGGGLYADRSSPILSQVTALGNGAREGGGLYLLSPADGQPLRIHNGILALNSARDGANTFATPDGSGDDGLHFMGALLFSHLGQSGHVGAPLPAGVLIADPTFYNDSRDGTPRNDSAHLKAESPAWAGGLPLALQGQHLLPYREVGGEAPALGAFGGPGDLAADRNGDGAPDRWARSMGLSSFQGSDFDGDGLSDGQEFQWGTDPRRADSDYDGISDGVEVERGLNPRRFQRPGAEGVLAETIRVPEDMPDLQSAIEFAEADSTIEVSPGLYYGAVDLWWKSLSIYGVAGSAETILDGQGDGSTFIAREVDGGLIFEGFTVRNGQAESGGGVNLIDSSVQIRDLNLMENVALNWGGGLQIVGGDGRVDTLAIHHNQSFSGGGGMHIDECDVAFDNLHIYGNRATQFGGGLMAWSFHAHLDRLIVEDNEAEQGGGIHLGYGYPHVDHPIVRGNRAVEGGGIYFDRSGYAKVNHALVVDNAATYDGGGLYADYASPILMQSVITENRGLKGGGLYFSIESRPTIHNSIFSLNQADEGENIYSVNFIPLLDNCVAWLDDEQDSGIDSGVPTGNGGIVNLTVADPQFLNAQAGDYRLLAPHSPAINGGSPTCLNDETGDVNLPCTDADGSLPDIGLFGAPDAGVDLDGDGYAQNPWWPESADGQAQVSGTYQAAIDCDDTDDLTYPGAIELVNGFDDDCDGEIDEAGDSGCAVGGASTRQNTPLGWLFAAFWAVIWGRRYMVRLNPSV